jgi:hypothetical protein
MAATREQIVEALFTVLKQSANFVVASRRNRDPEGMNPSDTPALFLVENSDGWNRDQGYNILPKRGMKLWAIIYIDVGPTDNNTIPSSFINTTLDVLEVLFAPDNVITDRFTLGGLVEACLLDGDSQRSPGDITGKALAVVPIRILFP